MIRLGADEKVSDFSAHYPEEFPAAEILISSHLTPQRRNQVSNELRQSETTPTPHPAL